MPVATDFSWYCSQRYRRPCLLTIASIRDLTSYGNITGVGTLTRPNGIRSKSSRFDWCRALVLPVLGD